MSHPRKAVRRFSANVAAGRLQRTLAAATAASAVPVGFDIYLEHYRGSFGNRLMWAPIATTPLVAAAGAAAVASPRAARTVLPVASLAYVLNGLTGMVMHARGVARKPGGFREPTFNLVMGPPLFAPGSLILIGSLGLLAAALPRER